MEFHHADICSATGRQSQNPSQCHISLPGKGEVRASGDSLAANAAEAAELVPTAGEGARALASKDVVKLLLRLVLVPAVDFGGTPPLADRLNEEAAKLA